MRRRMIVVKLALLLALPTLASAQDHDFRGSSGNSAGDVELTPDSRRGGGSITKVATTLALVGAGIGMVLAGNPRYVPSRFAPGNSPRRIDLGMYLGAGSYAGHSYELVYRRRNAFGTGFACPPYEPHCVIEAQELRDQYAFGFTDGHDVGRHEGLALGHEQGFTDGQAALIRILDANGFPVYEGEFLPASYARETFGDRKGMRYGGVGLLAAGALVGLLWPESRNLALIPLPGGGQVAASLGF